MDTGRVGQTTQQEATRQPGEGSGSTVHRKKGDEPGFATITHKNRQWISSPSIKGLFFYVVILISFVIIIRRVVLEDS